MSTQALLGAPAGVSAGELAAAQRVQQLQALIESTRQVASGGSLPGEHDRECPRDPVAGQRLRLSAAGGHDGRHSERLWSRGQPRRGGRVQHRLRAARRAGTADGAERRRGIGRIRIADRRRPLRATASTPRCCTA